MLGNVDESLRAAAFAYLDELTRRVGDQVSYRDLERFEFGGRRISLIQRMRGIRVVSGLETALSILTTYRARPEDRPYEDAEGADGYLRYKWRGDDPNNYDNVALRRAMQLDRPLIWFFGVAAGIYVPVYPIWLVGEETDQQQFVVAANREMAGQWLNPDIAQPADIALRREYAHAIVKQRLHQRVFRGRVLVAYESACALCRLRHPELLDAAHIKEDSDGGEPVVTNGVAMCAIHHRAFDHLVIGIRPDFVLEVRRDVLKEADGPTLQYALQGLHRGELVRPRQRLSWPDRNLLEERYERFRATG